MAWRGPGPEGSWNMTFGLGPAVPLKDDSVFSLYDRKVKVDGDEENMSLYTLCRRWVQNDPEQDESAPMPQRPGMQLPAMVVQHAPEAESELGPAPLEPPMPAEEGSPPPAAEDLMAHHLDHWRAVKQHHRTVIEQRATTDQQRLAMLLPRPDAGIGGHTAQQMLAPPTPMGLQQLQALQQMHMQTQMQPLAAAAHEVQHMSLPMHMQVQQQGGLLRPVPAALPLMQQQQQQAGAAGHGHGHPLHVPMQALPMPLQQVPAQQPHPQMLSDLQQDPVLLQQQHPPQQ